MDKNNLSVAAMPPQASHIEMVNSRLSATQDVLVKVRERLQGIHDRAFGESPSGGKVSPREVASGKAGATLMQLDEIGALVDHIEGLAGQLERIV